MSLNSINLDDTNFNEDDPNTIIYIRLLAWHNKLKQRKISKKINKRRIKDCSMVSNKMVGLVHVRR